MKHPPYHLRTNKAIDRQMLVEAAQLLGRAEDLATYTYYGFGGPYLEDFRLMHEAFPKMKMISFEEDAETYKRQQFHLPCSHIQLVDKEFRSYMAAATLDDAPGIFWLDYLGFELRAIDDFKALLSKSAASSIIKITVRCQPSDYEGEKGITSFRGKFDAYYSANESALPTRVSALAKVIQDIFQVAAQQALPSAGGMVFQPIYSSYYLDGNGMFSICGTICEAHTLDATRGRFRPHRIANLDWDEPTELDVPFLSTKERLRLQEHLPCPGDAGKRLSSELGYLIDKTRTKSEAKLAQYAQFYSHYPMFIKAIP